MTAVGEELRSRVDAALKAFLAERRSTLVEIDPALASVAEALEAFVLGGGKRLRPAFGYWAYRGCGGVDSAELIAALSSLELLHAGALIHDDVMDASDTRRGEPAVHRRFATAHRQAGWAGDSAAFGSSAAILLGDLCLVWSDQLFATSGLPPERLAAARPYFDAMRTEVMAGQYLDVLAQARRDTTTEQASKVAQFKSAKYTVERPLLVGGALAGATSQQLAAFTQYGIRVGEAFQLRDDILGVYGDPTETGKPSGGDLREGKRTYLVAAAMDAGDATQRATLTTLLGDPDLDESGVRTLQAIIRDTGALSRTEQRIASLTAQALEALEAAELAETAHQALRDLATAAAHRVT